MQREARASLIDALRARRSEIEGAVLTRVLAVSTRDERLDPDYAEGLGGTVVAAIEYGLETVELGEERAPPPPPALLAQARLAARSGISLDTVLRRYCAGHSLLADFLIEEAESQASLPRAALQGLLRAQASGLDRILVAVSEEHARERSSRPPTAEQRRAERIERLLAGKLVDGSQLNYDFDGHHIGLLASGPGSWTAVRELAGGFDRLLLTVRCEVDLTWAWLGGRAPLDPDELKAAAAAQLCSQSTVAIGEPGKGLAGWRLTHRQAKAALPVAQRGPESVVRYADVALLALILSDELLAISVHRLYLAPLEAESDGGKLLRETLRAYFATETNVSSAAALLGVKRETVTNRLRVIEERIGRTLGACAIEIEIALCAEQLSEGTLTGSAAIDRAV